MKKEISPTKTKIILGLISIALLSSFLCKVTNIPQYGTFVSLGIDTAAYGFCGIEVSNFYNELTIGCKKGNILHIPLGKNTLRQFPVP